MLACQFSKGNDPAKLSVKEVVAGFARNNERRMAQKVRVPDQRGAHIAPWAQQLPTTAAYKEACLSM